MHAGDCFASLAMTGGKRAHPGAKEPQKFRRVGTSGLSDVWLLLFEATYAMIEAWVGAKRVPSTYIRGTVTTGRIYRIGSGQPRPMMPRNYNSG